MSAIFISHSSKDNAWAERIRDWLKDEQQQRPVEHRYRSLLLDCDPDDGIHSQSVLDYLGTLHQQRLPEFAAHLERCSSVI